MCLSLGVPSHCLLWVGDGCEAADEAPRPPLVQALVARGGAVVPDEVTVAAVVAGARYLRPGGRAG